MTKNVLSALFSAARGLLRNFAALLVLAIIYAALIVAAVVFVTTREASTAQLALTALAAIAVPVLFFLVAAGCAAYAVGETRPAGILRRALANFLKVLLVSLPVLALVVGTVWAMNKLESRVKHDPRDEASVEYSANTVDEESGDSSAAEHPKPPVRWAYVFYSALRLLLLGVFLPLLAVHLWIAAVRDGLGGALKIHRVIARALSARSVFTYAVGMIVFALLPYFLIIKRTPASASWLELSFISIRLLAAFALTLSGFVATAAALARFDNGTNTDPARVQQPDAQPRPAEPASVTG